MESPLHSPPPGPMYSSVEKTSSGEIKARHGVAQALSEETQTSIDVSHLPADSTEVQFGSLITGKSLSKTDSDYSLQGVIPEISEIRNTTNTSSDVAQAKSTPFVPSLGAWAQRIKITPELKDPIPQNPPCDSPKTRSDLSSDILPPEIKENGDFRFPWAAKMDPKTRNLYRTTTPTYLEDGTPLVEIPNHVLMQGLENQKEYIIGQFSRCSTPPGGLVHAMANRIWGKKCKISSRKLGESSFSFHIPDESTRAWVLERRLWHIDGCIMFVAPWTPSASLALPEITSVPLWVTLKNIPNCLYSIWGISWIASGLGEPMLSHKPWLDPSLMGEAKLMVEVELDKNFPQRIAAGDKHGNISMVSVEYSWIPTKCERCGHLGHKESRCLMPKSFPDFSVGVNDVVKELTPTVNKVVNTSTAATPVASLNVPLASANPNTSVEVAPKPSSTIVAASAVDTLISVPQFVEAEPTTPLVNVSNATVVATPSAVQTVPSSPVFVFSPALVTQDDVSSDLLTNEEEENVFKGNFASLDPEYSRFEMGDLSRSRGGRPIKPTQKMQELQWTQVRGRNKGRRGRLPPL